MKTYQEFVVEAKKCWPGYKKKGTQKLFGKTYNRCVKEPKESFNYVEEASNYNKYPHFSSKEELIRHYKGSIPSHLYPKNRGSKEKPKWGLGSVSSRENTTQRREENRKTVTGNLTRRQKYKVERKYALAARRGKDVHHNTELETSARQMQNMSPGDKLRFKQKESKRNRHHGDDPKNLVLANKGPVSSFRPEQPGFHHGKYHSFERSNRSRLRDIENAISPSRAFTTLVNRERRKSKKSRELQARMSAAAERNKIED